MSSNEQINSGQIVDIEQLSDEERKIYIAEKIQKYKLTFVVCFIYGLIALILFIVATFTSYGSVLYNDLAPFTITYILGTIVIIIFLANEIYNFKPRKFENKLGYDAEMCPDYWKLEYVKDPNSKDSNGKTFLDGANVNTLQFNYKCVLDETVFNKRRFKEIDNTKRLDDRKGYDIGVNNRLYIPLNNDEKFGKLNGKLPNEQIMNDFKKIAATMSGYEYKPVEKSLTKRSNNENVLTPLTGEFSGTNIPLSCDTVYPVYLASMDNENAKKNSNEPNNRFRCAYSRACGVPWSEAGCI
jgi:hypothetical protein